MGSGTASARRAEVRRPPAGAPAHLPYSKLSALSETQHWATQPGGTCPRARPDFPGAVWAGTLGRAPSLSNENGPAGQVWRPDSRGQMRDRAPVHRGPCPPLMGPPDRPPTHRKPGLCVLVQRDMETETEGVGRRRPWIAPRPRFSTLFFKLLFLVIKLMWLGRGSLLGPAKSWPRGPQE